MIKYRVFLGFTTGYKFDELPTYTDDVIVYDKAFSNLNDAIIFLETVNIRQAATLKSFLVDGGEFTYPSKLGGHFIEAYKLVDMVDSYDDYDEYIKTVYSLSYSDYSGYTVRGL